jgi:hypothetical protein
MREVWAHAGVFSDPSLGDYLPALQAQKHTLANRAYDRVYDCFFFVVY